MSANGVHLDRNQLTTREMFLLAQAILAAKDDLVRDRPNRLAVAHRMTGQLGFKVTPANVGKAAKACGVEWRTRAKAGSRRTRPNGDWYARVVRLEALVEKAVERLNMLAEEFGHQEITEPKVEMTGTEIDE